MATKTIAKPLLVGSETEYSTASDGSGRSRLRRVAPPSIGGLDHEWNTIDQLLRDPERLLDSISQREIQSYLDRNMQVDGQ